MRARRAGGLPVWLRYWLCGALALAAVAASLALPGAAARRQRALGMGVVRVEQEGLVLDDATVQRGRRLRLLLLSVTDRAQAQRTTLEPPRPDELSPAQAVEAGRAACRALARLGVEPPAAEGEAIDEPVYGAPEAVAGRSLYFRLTDAGTGESYGYYLLVAGGSALTLDAQGGQLLQLEAHYGNRALEPRPPEEYAAAIAQYLDMGALGEAQQSGGMFHAFSLGEGRYTLQLGIKESTPAGLSFWCYPAGMDAPYQDHYQE